MYYSALLGLLCTLHMSWLPDCLDSNIRYKQTTRQLDRRLELERESSINFCRTTVGGRSADWDDQGGGGAAGAGAEGGAPPACCLVIMSPESENLILIGARDSE